MVFQPTGVGDQGPRLLPHLALRAGRRFGAGVPIGFVAKLMRFFHQPPRDLHIWVCLDHQIKRVLAQLRQHPGRMTQANRLLVVTHQPLQEVINRQIARRVGQHLLAAGCSAANQFDDRSRLPGSRRAMHTYGFSVH